MFLRWIRLLLLAIALTGAPFGMGRMMDTAHAGQASDATRQTSGHHQQSAPAHNADVPHYVSCPACAAAPFEASSGQQLMVLRGALVAGNAETMTGIRAIPATPPPRA